MKIFISSPGDVDKERRIAERLIGRLVKEFVGRVPIDPYFWEYEPMRHDRNFQDQIPSTTQFDLIICILWSRLGTPFKGPDGLEYASGTEYEILCAREAQRTLGKATIESIGALLRRNPTRIEFGLSAALEHAADLLRQEETAWLPDLAETVSGLTISDSNAYVPVNPKKFFKLKDQLANASGDDFWSKTNRWFFADCDMSIISPQSNMTISEYRAVSVTSPIAGH